MEKDIYLTELFGLRDLMEQVPNTPFSMYAKVLTLAIMNMRYEKVAFNMKLAKHPYVLTKEIIADSVNMFNALMDASFIESKNKLTKEAKSQIQNEKHRELWNEIWDRYSAKEFAEYINLQLNRIKINNLTKLVEGKKCVDLGCGNGVFSFALLEAKASFVAGVDFGEKSIKYATKYADKMKLKKKVQFKYASVYETGLEDNSFDFAIQNGVFHHLDDYEKAIVEARRILKEGGWFFYYTDGSGSMTYDLWDISVGILKDVPVLFIEDILNSLNISRNKIAHLSDGLSATYRHSSWKEVTSVLSKYGFGNFRRLIGGTDTDFDHDRIAKDPYGKEKFGEGDLRLICQLKDK